MACIHAVVTWAGEVEVSLSRGAVQIPFVLLSLVAACGPPPAEDIRLPAVFGDGMVLQRETPVTVWGSATHPGTVRVSIDGQEVVTRVHEDGSWVTNLPAMPAGGPFTLTVSGAESTSFSDVLLGEVWVASGQSNMEWPLARTADSVNAAKEADYPQIRLFTVARATSDVPLTDVETDGWSAVTPESVLGFSAVAYYFGRHLHGELGVPIGLIDNAWGGTPAESWTSAEKLASMPQLGVDLENVRAIAEDRGSPQWVPSSLFNGMLAPVIPYTIRGAIWYQGESNAGRAYNYRALFSGMIEDWRAHWGIGDFPFLFVQLANFREMQDEPSEAETWPELREAQAMALELPNTGQAVIIDIGEADDIHPRNKLDVGVRLALAARHVAHGEDLVHSGPVYAGMAIDGSEVRIRFDHVGGGLVARGGTLEGFAIAGEDRTFVWADGRIEGDEIVLSTPSVEAPVAARYAWANNPVISLYNAEGLPASPFRTDDWPGVTEPR
jgi:sialate O-acetylesterase